MRVRTFLSLLTVAVGLVVAARPAAGRTDCAANVTAVCVELAQDVAAYQSLLWTLCANDSETVCTCYNAQQTTAGVDFCQWATCACRDVEDKNLKGGICGLAAGCAGVAAVKQQQQALAAQAGPAQLAAQVQQVRSGQSIDCAPETCLAVGAACARAVGALEILKDQGTIADGVSCATLAKDAVAFGKQLHVDGLTTAVGACACAAAF